MKTFDFSKKKTKPTADAGDEFSRILCGWNMAEVPTRVAFNSNSRPLNLKVMNIYLKSIRDSMAVRFKKKIIIQSLVSFSSAFIWYVFYLL